jgi:hypothetical protein
MNKSPPQTTFVTYSQLTKVLNFCRNHLCDFRHKKERVSKILQNLCIDRRPKTKTMSTKLSKSRCEMQLVDVGSTNTAESTVHFF